MQGSKVEKIQNRANKFELVWKINWNERRQIVGQLKARKEFSSKCSTTLDINREPYGEVFNYIDIKTGVMYEKGGLVCYAEELPTLNVDLKCITYRYVMSNKGVTRNEFAEIYKRWCESYKEQCVISVTVLLDMGDLGYAHQSMIVLNGTESEEQKQELLNVEIESLKRDCLGDLNDYLGEIRNCCWAVNKTITWSKVKPLEEE